MPFVRIRSNVVAQFTPREVIHSVRLEHQQVYDFAFHRGKVQFILNLPGHFHFERMRRFLENVETRCPRELFASKTTKGRASQSKRLFANQDPPLLVLGKEQNKAVAIAEFVLQAVPNNRNRHSELQAYMLACDSVTIAVEVPVVILPQDFDYFRQELGFEIPDVFSETLTGHIDFVQIRNHRVYLLDYKPDAEKIAPIDQLTIYALALSRITGLRLSDFRCAWFSDQVYKEFSPLDVVLPREGERSAPENSQVVQLPGRSEVKVNPYRKGA